MVSIRREVSLGEPNQWPNHLPTQWCHQKSGYQGGLALINDVIKTQST